MLETLIAVLGQLITVYFIIFLLAVVFFVKLQRTLVEMISEYFFPNSEFIQSKLWRSFLLPFAPSGTGMVMAWLWGKFPYPDLLTSTGGHMMYGIGVGLLSNMLYSMIKELLADSIRSLANKIKNQISPDQGK